jgi:hypothetical protein
MATESRIAITRNDIKIYRSKKPAKVNFTGFLTNNDQNWATYLGVVVVAVPGDFALK